MCGICAYKGKRKDTLKILINGLKQLEYRGYDSAGLAYQSEGKIQISKEVGRVFNLESNLDLKKSSNIGIAHTRWATHGNVTKTNSHPHTIGKTTIVHNGIIENYQELKNELQRDYDFQSQTDTEVLAAFIDKNWSLGFDKLNVLIKNKIKGSYATVIMREDDDNLYVIKKDSPLIVAESDNGFYISSDVLALDKSCTYYYVLNNYEAVIVGEELIFYLEDKKIDKSKHKIEELEFDNTLGEYEHYMLKEIHDEVKLVDNLLREYWIDLETFKNKILDISKYEKIDIVACGSAYYAGMLGKYVLEQFTKAFINIDVASEYRYAKHNYKDNTLVIFISQSGETADTLACLRSLPENVDTLALVNVETSALRRESKYSILSKCGREIAVATTKAYMAQVLSIYMLAFRTDINLKDKFNEYKNEFKKFGEYVKDNTVKEYKEIVDVIKNDKDIFFVGRLKDYALAMEGSLKLKEICYLNAFPYQAGEFKHGTISLIEDGSKVINIITDENIALKTVSNMEELKSRGAINIVVCDSKLKDLIDADYYISIKHDLKYLGSVLAVVPLQLIAYYTAVELGREIDKPRNLAKSVTVE